MIKRILSLLLITAILTGTALVGFAEEAVNENLYEKETQFLIHAELLSANTVAADAMTRGNFVKLITDILYYEVDISAVHTTKFSDVNFGTEYYNAVCILEGLGVINGNGSGKS